jgi:hypothetical protein
MAGHLMPDPRFLYIVSAVVLVALVAWVVLVWMRAPPNPPAPPGQSPRAPSDPKHPTDPAAPAAKRAQSQPDAKGELRSSKPALDSHLEIQDEPAGSEPHAKD